MSDKKYNKDGSIKYYSFAYKDFKDSIFILDGPYYTQEQDDCGKNKVLYTYDDLMCNSHLKGKESKFPIKENSFLQISSKLCAGGPRYGITVTPKVFIELYQKGQLLKSGIDNAKFHLKQHSDIYKKMIEDTNELKKNNSLLDKYRYQYR